MAPKKPNKHTLETYYSEWDISMAGSITAGITLKIYGLLKDEENNVMKFIFVHYFRLHKPVKFLCTCTVGEDDEAILILKPI